MRHLLFNTAAAICFAAPDLRQGGALRPGKKSAPRQSPEDDEADIDPDLPAYRLTLRSYFDRVYEEGEIVQTKLVPGPHMTPLNDLARAMAEESPKGFDPTRQLNTVPRFQSNSAEDLLAGLLSRLTQAPAAPPPDATA